MQVDFTPVLRGLRDTKVAAASGGLFGGGSGFGVWGLGLGAETALNSKFHLISDLMFRLVLNYLSPLNIHINIPISLLSFDFPSFLRLSSGFLWPSELDFGKLLP